MSNKQRCGIVGTITFFVICILLGFSSYEAIALVIDPWRAVDYWLAWFSIFSLLGSAGCGIAAAVNLGTALSCDEQEEK